MGRKRRRPWLSPSDSRKKNRDYRKSAAERKQTHNLHSAHEPQPGPSNQKQESDSDHEPQESDSDLEVTNEIEVAAYEEIQTLFHAPAEESDEETLAAEPRNHLHHAAPGNAAPMNHLRQRPTKFKARQFPPVVERFSLGPFDKKCEYCGAIRFKNEFDETNCCHKGKVDLPPLDPYPDELKALLTYNDTESTHFLDNIRQYNSSMSFASFVASGLSPLQGRGPYTFRLHGQVYHCMGALHPLPDKSPTYSQLYVIEGNQAVEGRLSHQNNKNLKRQIVTTLTTIMDRINPFAAAYRYMHEVEQQQQAIADTNGTPMPDVKMYMKRGHDRRRYNEPRHDEVAAVFVSGDGAPPASHDAIVYPKAKQNKDGAEQLTTLNYMSALIDPMTYPIFFPAGEYGWQADMPHKLNRTANRNTVTHMQFYAYRLAIRSAFSPIFHGGKLFQQYIVDSYLRVEANRLNFVKTQQSQLRVDSYQGLMDHIHSQAEEQGREPGNVVILPSSFQGSPRAMQQNYQDAMAIVRKYGKPDLYVTFTCNPKWKEIVDNLLPGQTAADRPDLVARVFKLYLDELL